KISPFGLMEISRQRRRTGVLEGTTHVCEHCQGVGRVRSVESSALAALRAVEVEALKGGGELALKVPRAVGLYILNEKRGHLARLHENLDLFVTVVIDDPLPHAEHEIERTASETRPDHAVVAKAPAQLPLAEPELDVFDEVEDEEEEEIELEDETGEDDAARAEAEDSGRGGRRRRRRRGRRGEEPREAHAEASEPTPEASDEEGHGRRRRRGRRGGRRMREDGRPTDAYAWVRPWVPYGDDPFVWHDPSQDIPVIVEVAAPAPAAVEP